MILFRKYYKDANNDIVPSDELMNKILENAHKKKPAPQFYKYASAAAAVVVAVAVTAALPFINRNTDLSEHTVITTAESEKPQGTAKPAGTEKPGASAQPAKSAAPRSSEKPSAADKKADKESGNTQTETEKNSETKTDNGAAWQNRGNTSVGAVSGGSAAGGESIAENGGARVDKAQENSSASAGLHTPSEHKAATAAPAESSSNITASGSKAEQSDAYGDSDENTIEQGAVPEDMPALEAQPGSYVSDNASMSGGSTGSSGGSGGSASSGSMGSSGGSGGSASSGSMGSSGGSGGSASSGSTGSSGGSNGAAQSAPMHSVQPPSGYVTSLYTDECIVFTNGSDTVTVDLYTVNLGDSAPEYTDDGSAVLTVSGIQYYIRSSSGNSDAVREVADSIY